LKREEFKLSYIIGSGWWCGESGNDEWLKGGDDFIRGKEFHKLWYRSIMENFSPEKIVIIDSNSPIKPDLAPDERIEFISLPLNAGHATNHAGKYCGWTRSILAGLQYAILSDVEYFIYVEQDALINLSEGRLNEILSTMKSPYMFGGGAGTSHSLQQSFFIIRKDGMEGFINRYFSINCNDNGVSPESKFAIAASKLWSLFPVWFWSLKPGLTSRILKLHKGFDLLPVPGGRSRPIDFSRDYYFQHGDVKEVNSHFDVRGWTRS